MERMPVPMQGFHSLINRYNGREHSSLRPYGRKTAYRPKRGDNNMTNTIRISVNTGGCRMSQAMVRVNEVDSSVLALLQAKSLMTASSMTVR